MRPLFVNHTGVTSGAEASLLDVLSGLPEDVEPLVACPHGQLTESLRGAGVKVRRIPAIDASLRLHPVHTTRGAAQLGRAAWAVRQAARAHRADLVHANSTRAGLAATLAFTRGGPPVIVHVRDCLPEGRAADVTRTFLANRAALVLANSRYTAANFTRGDGAEVEVLHSPIDLKRFNPDRIDREQARTQLGLGSEPVLAVVGQITPWKGHATALEALALVRRDGNNASLLIVGSVKFTSAATRYDNTSYLRSLEQMVDELALNDYVTFMGERTDVPEVLRAIDVLLVPSWEEPFGRSVVEAMAMKTPVIATRIGGPAEVIDDADTGRLLPPRDAETWARAIAELIADDALRQGLGDRGRRRAMSFGRDAHVDRLLAIYRKVLS